jgi:hypothetical protein
MEDTCSQGMTYDAELEDTTSSPTFEVARSSIGEAVLNRLASRTKLWMSGEVCRPSVQRNLANRWIIRVCVGEGCVLHR